MKNITVLFNPNAGKGRAAKHAARIKERLAADYNVTLFESQSISATNEYFANLSDIPDALVVIGGDGTLGTVVSAMLNANLSIPIFPFGQGTANDFAHYFKTNGKLKNLNFQNKKTVDAMSVQGGHAINIVCGGAFTNGVTGYKRGTKKIWGIWAYYFRAAISAFRLKHQTVEFEIDGKFFSEKIYAFFIVNTTCSGGFKKLASKATHDDGLLDLVAIKKTNIISLVTVLFSIIFGRTHKNHHVMYIQGKTFSVKPVGKITHNFTVGDIDGNGDGVYPLNVAVEPGKVEIFY